jgi:endonuclease/exonuclease/phosphatase family metal-dependent hydrolase
MSSDATISPVLAILVTLFALVAGAPGATVTASHRGEPNSVLQMNLCLSGLAGCYAGTRYPAVVDEAIGQIRATGADAVTLNEACSGDVERIARETGYDHRFATVIYGGARLPCRNPGDRGVFGDAVLTRESITASEDAPFVRQFGEEERRWVCVATSGGAQVCTSHLDVGGTPEQQATNDAQCAELSQILAASGHRTIFGGDVNRQGSCAPAGAWTERDAEAAQAPGIQHVYGTRPGFVSPRETVLPMAYSDHDALLVSYR